MSSQHASSEPGHEPGAQGFAALLLGLGRADGDLDLLLGGGVVLSWRGGRVAALEPRFDPVALVLGAGAAPDAVAAALALRPEGLDGLALLAWLAGAGLAGDRLVTGTATELAVEAAAELLALPPEKVQPVRVPGDRPPAVDLGIAAAELLALATSRHEELAGLAAVVAGPAAVPLLTGVPHTGDATAEAALLGRIDGRRTVGDLAAATGRTRFETATTLAALAAAGIVRLTPGSAAWPTRPAAPMERAGLREDAWLELREVATGVHQRRPGPGTAPGPEPDPEPGRVPAPVPVPVPAPVPVPVLAPVPVPAVHADVDSSSLLRELASINMGDEPRAAGEGDEQQPQRRMVAAGAGSGRDEQARGGLFGFRRTARR